jgi:hypothetical protein
LLQEGEEKEEMDPMLIVPSGTDKVLVSIY